VQTTKGQAKQALAAGAITPRHRASCFIITQTQPSGAATKRGNKRRTGMEMEGRLVVERRLWIFEPAPPLARYTGSYPQRCRSQTWRARVDIASLVRRLGQRRAAKGRKNSRGGHARVVWEIDTTRSDVRRNFPWSHSHVDRYASCNQQRRLSDCCTVVCWYEFFSLSSITAVHVLQGPSITDGIFACACLSWIRNREDDTVYAARVDSRQIHNTSDVVKTTSSGHV
jgi:hypothetical protein